ncbi:MAG TPA: hypothetical protein VMU22_11125 [Rhizomicrobium sp.]|nr:hypothetical protein [Rhizomicrobium sp.]
MGRKLFLGIIAAFALVQAAVAGAPRQIPFDIDTIIMPADSPLKFKSFDKEEITAHFAGRVVLSGTYHYGMNEQADDWSVTLTLDPASRGLLPYWKNRPGDGTLWIDNEADFIRAVIPRAMIDALKRKKSGSISAHVSIVAEDYKAAVVCDAPDYSVRFVSLATTSLAALNTRPAEFGC